MGSSNELARTQMVVPVQVMQAPVRAPEYQIVRAAPLPAAPMRREGAQMSHEDARHGLARVGQVAVIGATASIALPLSDALVERTTWEESTRAVAQGAGLGVPGVVMVFSGYMPEVGAGLFVAGVAGGLRRGVRAFMRSRVIERVRASFVRPSAGYLEGLPRGVEVEARVG